jgi:hypothetical protein
MGALKAVVDSLFFSRSVALAVLLTVAATAGAATRSDVAFEPDAVVVHVTPRAKVALFGIMRVPSGYGLKFAEHVKLETDADGDGVVQYDLAGVGGSDSMWLVVDLTSGGSEIVGPNLPAGRRKALPAAAMKGRGSGVSATLSAPHPVALVWLARPGVGAWYASVEDGTSRDGDGAPDDSATAVLNAMRPVGDSPAAPGDFAPRDVIVSVDPFTFTLADVTVEE